MFLEFSARKMETKPENGHSLGMSFQAMDEEPFQKRIKISVEPFLEPRIYSTTEDGVENVIT
jgi:hypothetical protein